MGAEDVPPEEWERTAVSTDPDPEDVASGAERRERIRKGLDSLSEHHRTIIILSDIEGLQYREIAEVLGIPMGTVMSRLHHARKRLREVLGSGFAALLVALMWLFGAMAPAEAQLPPMPPPGVLPPAVSAPGGAPAQEVCVYALVMFASSPPGGPPPGLAPTPDLASPAAPPGAPPPGSLDPQTGCGHPVRMRLWVPRLQKVFQYSHYEPVSAFETRMPVGMMQRFALPGGRELELQPLGIRSPVVRILVRVKRGIVGEIATVMDVPPRRPALIGGLPHESGVLIIAIRAN
jgi:hypothetical protein